MKPLLKELKTLEDHPVLIAVDDYNTWFDPTAFMYDDEAVSAFQLSVPGELKMFDRKKEYNSIWKLKNGLGIAATSLGKLEGRDHTFHDVSSSIPLKIEIPAYNQIEYLSAFSYYANFSVIDPCFNFDDFLLYRTFTNSNPYKMGVEAMAYFLPIVYEENDDKIEQAFFESLGDRNAAAPKMVKKYDQVPEDNLMFRDLKEGDSATQSKDEEGAAGKGKGKGGSGKKKDKKKK